jgi:hypothetical protein
MIMIGRRSTDRAARWHRLIEHWGPRRARLLLLLATALYVAMMLVAAVLLLRQGPPWERWLRAGLVAVLALIGLWLWLRVLRIQWARLRVESAGLGPESEETGIWGVGGPGMRTPGSTGLTRILPHRRAQDGEDGELPP